MKAWFAYQGSPDWLHCFMILENGWAPFIHICSHPFFAPGDLWFTRKERQAIFSEMGITLDEPIETVRADQIPKEVWEKNQNEENWKALSDQYQAIKNRGAHETPAHS